MNIPKGASLDVGNHKVVVGDTLGQGAFGVVYKASSPTGTSVYALKDILCTNTSEIKQAIDEVKTLFKVRHNNVVQISDAGQHITITGSVHILILTEFCSGGNLNERLWRQSSYQINIQWVKQLASALSYLHDQNIVHRDLKPENVLLSDPVTEDIKIGDFGLAREYFALKRVEVSDLLLFYTKYYMDTYAGSPPWMAPEVFRGHYTKMADVFSLGCIFYAILVRQYINFGVKRYYGAFVNVQGQGKVPLGAAKETYSAKITVEFPATSTASRSLKEITLDALQFDPRVRPTARDLCYRIAAIGSAIKLQSGQDHQQPIQRGCCW